MANHVSRRDVLASVSALGLTTIGTTAALAGDLAAHQANRRRVLRIAHLTDIHVQPERSAALGMERALIHAQEQQPDMIMLGGDQIMDAFAATRERTRTQWDIYQRVLKANTSVPVEPCIGNHDIWGWNKERAGATGDEADWGKKWAMEEMGLTHPYRTFDRAGWRFIVLDGTFPRGTGYVAQLDDEQYEWLEATVRATPETMPILVLSHMPIFGACPFFDGDNERTGNWQVPGAWMHIDARKIVSMFYETKRVKVCLSGHIHLVDRVDYLGTTYYCNGAVSAGWWSGPCQQFNNGYGLCDLYDDGSFENRYVEFPWTVT